MPGIVGVYSEKTIEDKYVDIECNNFKNYKIIGSNYKIEVFHNNKFSNDKVAYEDDQFIIVTDGVILNSKELLKNYKCDSLIDLIKVIYKEQGESFFELFKGSFCGAIYDKSKKKWIVYTNHVGDRPIFYYKKDNLIFFSSNLYYLVNYIKTYGESIKLSEIGAYSLLSYGYMLDNYTLFDGVIRLQGGQYVVIENRDVILKNYFKIDNTPNDTYTEEEIINKLDDLFRNAVKLQFDKDKEYGYKHMVSISGGLDSRMTTWVAHDLGYGNNMLSYTFAQSNCDDEIIAKKIATDLRNEYIYKALDDAKFLYNLEDTIKISGGLNPYYASAFSINMLQSLNLESYGIVHTGQIGDIVIGSFCKGEVAEPYDINKGKGAYSKVMIDRIPVDKINLHKDEEEFLIYNRAMNFALVGNLSYQQQTETFSPFYDVELLKFAFSIPLKYRANHNLYYKWIISKYPDAANYKYESLGDKITTPISIRFTKRVIRRILNKILRILKINVKPSMNPYDYWYNNNDSLRGFIDNYYKEHLELLDEYPIIKNDCIELFENHSMIEKIQVITLLATLKVYT